MQIPYLIFDIIHGISSMCWGWRYKSSIERDLKVCLGKIPLIYIFPVQSDKKCQVLLLGDTPKARKKVHLSSTEMEVRELKLVSSLPNTSKIAVEWELRGHLLTCLLQFSSPIELATAFLFPSSSPAPFPKETLCGQVYTEKKTARRVKFSSARQCLDLLNTLRTHH